MHKITLIPGDGIGPEVTGATRKVIEAAGVDIEWEVAEAGAKMIEECGKPLPDAVLESIKKNKIALKGPVTTPIGTGFRSVNVTLRKTLNLYANVRPIKSLPGVKSRYDNIDLVVVRENTEDLYAGIERQVSPDCAESIKIITKEATARIVHYAFQYARKNNRKKVTAVHKANIMKLSDGLFLKTFREIAEQYPEIEADDLIVDNTCMQLVMYPEQFDVLVLPNLYGDIVSDLCAGLIGGLGVAPGANIGLEEAVFEPIHGSAPLIAGQNIANPLACLLSGILMLRHIGEYEAADKIEQAVFAVLKEGKSLTADLGGKSSTDEMAEAVIAKLK